jgi:hypothetical protein
MTPAHRSTLDAAVAALRQDIRIVGVAAGGSYITGAMDEYSALDLVRQPGGRRRSRGRSGDSNGSETAVSPALRIKVSRGIRRRIRNG